MSIRRIQPGSIVDIIAPSGPFDVTAFGESVQLLLAMGLVPRFRPDIFARDRYLAGPDARRAEELTTALAAADSDVLWAARGGYGATRLMPELSTDAIRAAGKLLVGFSDITALHLRWRAAGVPSVHGTMVARLAREPEAVQERLLALLLEGEAAPLAGEPWVAGQAEGILAGGNLALMAASCGTSLQPRLHGCVLFIEDVGERPYRLDRMLVQCQQAGLLEGVVGLALGEFTECEEPSGTSSSRQVLAAFARELGLPTVAGLPCGHGAVNLALPMGVRVHLDATHGRLQPLQNLYADGGTTA